MFDDRLDKKLNPIIENQTKMQEDITGLKTGVKDLKTATEDLKTGQTKIELKIENQIERAIKVTMEGHADLKHKLDKNLGIERRVEILEDKVSALE